MAPFNSSGCRFHLIFLRRWGNPRVKLLLKIVRSSRIRQVQNVHRKRNQKYLPQDVTTKSEKYLRYKICPQKNTKRNARHIFWPTFPCLFFVVADMSVEESVINREYIMAVLQTHFWRIGEDIKWPISDLNHHCTSWTQLALIALAQQIPNSWSTVCDACPPLTLWA